MGEINHSAKEKAKGKRIMWFCVSDVKRALMKVLSEK